MLLLIKQNTEVSVHKLSFFTVNRDTGSNYNSFVGRYSSLEKLLECFKKNPDLIESYCNQTIQGLNSETIAVNSAEDYEVSFEVIKEVTSSGWSKESSHSLLITVSNVKVQKGEYKVTPEVKEVGKPYQPEQRVYHRLVEEFISKEYKLPIISDSITLDVIHLNYGEVVYLVGKKD